MAAATALRSGYALPSACRRRAILILIDARFSSRLSPRNLTLDAAAESSTRKPRAVEDETIPLSANAVSRIGDIWTLGRHRLVCGDAQNKNTFTSLLGEERADLIFTDPPYNVRIDGNAVGLGRHRHREFAFASGEMSEDQFTTFLSATLGNMAEHCRQAAIAFVCMDWRHQLELLTAGRRIFSELKNVCVWNKTNGGMGTFYRSKHELIFVFKIGEGEHTNTFGLGDTGRYRTNVWDYAGINTFSSSRSGDLAMHPTVKPVALVADAIRDCSRRGDIVLDAFGGSGTTLIAAEKTGRTARLIELDPRYCDTIVRRFEKTTGKAATLLASGMSFEDVEEHRSLKMELVS